MENHEKTFEREQLIHELHELLDLLGWNYMELAREIDRQDHENPDDDIDKIKERVRKSLQKSRLKSIKLSTLQSYIACIKSSRNYKNLGKPISIPIVEDDLEKQALFKKIRQISQKFLSEQNSYKK